MHTKRDLAQVQSDVAMQREASLRLARVARKRQRILREGLKSGEVDPGKVIRGESDPGIEEVVGSMILSRFLPMLPGVGKSRAHDIIEAFDASPRTRIRQLSTERRAQLAMIVSGAIDPHRHVG